MEQLTTKPGNSNKRSVSDNSKKQKEQTAPQQPTQQALFQPEKYYQNIKPDFTYLFNFGYHIYQELGRGGYGVVYKAYAVQNGTEVDKQRKFAIKINFLTVTPQLIYSEIAFLRLVKGHRNMPNLSDLFIYQDKIHIVIEYFKFKPFIVNKLKTKKNIIYFNFIAAKWSYFSEFSMLDVQYYLYELVKGLKVLKQLGILHRDIQPGNFLYNQQQKRGIIIDFGLSELDQTVVNASIRKEKQSREISSTQEQEQLSKVNELYQSIQQCMQQVGTNKIGTQSFMPLESILRYSKQSYSVDMWAVGVIMLQFTLQQYNIFNNVKMINKPSFIKNNYFINFILELSNFYGTQAVQKQCLIYGYQVRFPDGLPKDPINFKDIAIIEGFDDVANNLLSRLLALDPTQRITVQEAVEHPFFNEIK